MPWTGGEWLLFGAAALVYLGVAHRVLDRMRLTRRTALLFLGLLAAGPFLPDIRLGPLVSVNPGGFLVPLGVATYLVATADRAAERRRAVAAALLTGAALFAMDRALPLEPGQDVAFDLDPVWAPGILAAGFGYLAGRSRRAAFVAGTAGVVVADLLAVAANLGRGVAGALVGIGAAGPFDAIAVGGILAVVLVEAFGETREWLARRARPRGTRQGTGPGAAGAPARRRLPGGFGQSDGLLGPVAVAAALAALGLAAGPRLGAAADELPEGRWMRLVDEAGAVLLHTGRRITVGDEWISADNVRYAVVAVRGLEAVAERLGVVDLEAEAADPAGVPGPWNGRPAGVTHAQEPGPIPEPFRDLLEPLLPPGGGTVPGPDAGPDLPERAPGPAPGNLPLVGVYHTHNAEAYVPTDGTASRVPWGGIREVGKALVAALRAEGFEVRWSQAIHLPHDRGAYRRSRRTVARLLTDGPAILIDVHRDAAPRDFYRVTVRGEEVVGIRFVIGRQNPHRASNLAFARRMKAAADAVTPGLVKGIFIGRGNYNQDVGPRAILIEVGAHTNDRSEAERGAALFARVLREYVRRAGLAGD